MLQKISLGRVQTQAPPGEPVIQGKVGIDPFSSQTTSHTSAWASSSSSQPMQPPSPPAPQIPLQSVHPSQKFVMVIDDSQTVRKILETCLHREGFQVKSFPDGIEAMRWLTMPYARVPDMIWLDIGLPKMDGYEVARRIKAKPQHSHIVIVMLSRRDGVVDRLKGRLAGAKEFFSKPFKTQDIVSVTQSYLGLALSEQETLHQPRVAFA